MFKNVLIRSNGDHWNFMVQKPTLQIYSYNLVWVFCERFLVVVLNDKKLILVLCEFLHDLSLHVFSLNKFSRLSCRIECWMMCQLLESPKMSNPSLVIVLSTIQLLPQFLPNLDPHQFLLPSSAVFCNVFQPASASMFPAWILLAFSVHSDSLYQLLTFMLHSLILLVLLLVIFVVVFFVFVYLPLVLTFSKA